MNPHQIFDRLDHALGVAYEIVVDLLRRRVVRDTSEPLWGSSAAHMVEQHRPLERNIDVSQRKSRAIWIKFRPPVWRRP
jgi:hypothetical protein